MNTFLAVVLGCVIATVLLYIAALFYVTTRQFGALYVIHGLYKHPKHGDMYAYRKYAIGISSTGLARKTLLIVVLKCGANQRKRVFTYLDRGSLPNFRFDLRTLENGRPDLIPGDEE